MESDILVIEGLHALSDEILKEIQSHTDISLYVTKEPYIKELSKDNIINLTGQSGSGKSTYAKENFNSEEYIIIECYRNLSDKEKDMVKRTIAYNEWLLNHGKEFLGK